MTAPVLVCFAVPSEAKPFARQLSASERVRVLVTGMGSRNAEAALRSALSRTRPSYVFSCGFAGALDCDLRVGDVIYDTADAPCAAKLKAAGARAVTFFCSPRVAIMAAEKAEIRRVSNASAVEMESSVIVGICREAGISCATVRAISDVATEDLPLDFNALMTRDQRLSPIKLGAALIVRPNKIPALLRLGRNSAFAAKQLAAVLLKIM